MPLPDKVIEQLGREPVKTPGWALGAVFFSGGIFFLVLLIYFGLTLGYEPYLTAQIKKTQDQITQLSQSISPTDQANLLNFYSQIFNLRSMLRTHIISSQLLAWLEQNTEANIAYQSLVLADNNQLTLGGSAKTEADVNQQIALFEAAPLITRVNVSTVGIAQEGTGYTFAVTLVIDPRLMTSPLSTTAPATGTGAAASTTPTPTK